MADYYTLLTTAGIAYETACKAAGLPIKLVQISVGDGGGAVYNPDANAKALKREVWRGPLNALFQDEKNPSWLLAEVTIPPDVGGWYVREAGLWTDTGILYAVVKYPESYKPVLATSGSGKEFYIRSIFETSNASLVTLLIDDTVVKATRAWVMDYVGDALGKATYTKAEVEAMIAKASALPVGVMVPFPIGVVPPGYLEADNSLFKDDVYPDLAAYLAKTFNVAGDAAGYTRLPESRGEFFRGWDHGRGVDAGRAIGSWQEDMFKSHTHRLQYGQNAGGGMGSPGYQYTGTLNSGIEATGGSETRPRNLVVMWCIKAWNAPVNQGSIDIAVLAVLGAQATEINQGTAKIATDTQMLDSAIDSVIATPKKLRKGFAISLAANGYIAFPTWLGGIVLQWGNATALSGSVPVTFPMAFPSSCLLSPFMSASSSTPQWLSWASGNLTRTGFSAYCGVSYSNGSYGSGSFNWLAIGY